MGNRRRPGCSSISCKLATRARAVGAIGEITAFCKPRAGFNPLGELYRVRDQTRMRKVGGDHGSEGPTVFDKLATVSSSRSSLIGFGTMSAPRGAREGLEVETMTGIRASASSDCMAW